MSAEFTKTQKRTPRLSQRGRPRKPGARPLTLPAVRARETRQRILDAARAVFAREGYGQAPVEAIVVEAGISRGAFYHHFAGKEELLRALLDDHLRGEMMELGALAGASSLSEAIERFVEFQIAHLESDRGSLSMEFWAEATRDEAVRRPVVEFHRRGQQAIAGTLRIAQRASSVRADLDVNAAAWLLLAVFEGLETLQRLDPNAVDLAALRQSWNELTAKFIGSEGEGGFDQAQEEIRALLERPFAQEGLPEGDAQDAT